MDEDVMIYVHSISGCDSMIWDKKTCFFSTKVNITNIYSKDALTTLNQYVDMTVCLGQKQLFYANKSSSQRNKMH